MKKYAGKIMNWTLVSLTCVILAIVCIMPGHNAQAALTKTTAFDTIDAWQALGTAVMAVGNAEDISGSYATVVYLEVALTNTNAQSGVSVLVEISYADDDWILWWGPFTGTAETPATTTLNDGAANAGDPDIILTDATTGDFDVPLRKWFIVSGTVANSESVKTDINAVHTVTLCQDLLRSHANGLNVWDRVDEWAINIPFAASFVRVIVYNSDADATIHWRSYCSKVTSMN
jgi:hypothetical protein